MIASSMSLHDLLQPLLFSLLATQFAGAVDSTGMYPFACSESIKSCNALLYNTNTDLQTDQIASFYSVNSSQIRIIDRGIKHYYLVTVPCSCQQVNGTFGYFYDTSYAVQPNETFVNVSAQIYSGQAWRVGGEEKRFSAGDEFVMHLLCGCVESESQVVVTYTVQQHDTLSVIANLLSARVEGVENMNKNLTQNPAFIDVGWVLFVPTEINGIPAPKNERRHMWTIIMGILSTVTLLSISTLIIIVIRRKRSRQNTGEDPKAVSKSLSTKRTSSWQNLYLHNDTMEEKPVIFNLEEIEEATNKFDETKIIGVGGYGSVYFGVLGGKEVAIKKMRSNKSKEFFAELKVLCKIHHINVVELLGYASGDDHLYLVYEYVQNGSLSDHLHDPLLKARNLNLYGTNKVLTEGANESGHQPLSWTARTQIALDAAKGIEYIHDHTKARYVHRDIKTSNILLDERLRAKVADFGLAKLVGQTSEEDSIATRLVGTPGYLPPESVKELQVTPKTDVFAFGVVLAELITGLRALFRDNREPNKTKSLITIVNKVFQDVDPEAALEAVIDGNLRDSYPMEDAYKMAEIAGWCLSEDAGDRPGMREIVVTLSQIMVSSVEWEASLGGNSQVFSGMFNGR